MQPNHDPHDDAQLRGLLREWEAPETPASLERRVLRARPSHPYRSPWFLAAWRFLVGGYIRVPVPVACALAVLLSVAAWKVSVRPPAPCAAENTIAPENHAARISQQDRCDHPAPGVC
jgi:hypothetical protein